MSAQGATEAVRKVARRWAKACRAGDSSAIVALLADNAVVWYNFERIEHDRAAYKAILDEGYKTHRNPRYYDFRMSVHPGGFVEQATLLCDTDDGPVSSPFCLIAAVEGGMIARIDEYFDRSLDRRG